MQTPRFPSISAIAGSHVGTHPRQGLKVRRHHEVRPGYGAEQRIRDSHRILEQYSDYFAAHKRAAQFRWKRIGLMNLALERRAEARRAFVRALVSRPNAADLRHLLRTCFG
jgi:hypothetical protein